MAGYIHIGAKIEELLEEQHKTKSELASDLDMSQGNAGHLTRRENIDVQMVHRIGNVLKYNFWKHFPIDDGNKDTAEAENARLRQLNEEKEKALSELKEQLKQLGEQGKLVDDMKRGLELLKQENGYLKEINALLKKK